MTNYAVFVSGQYIECTVCRELAKNTAQRMCGQIIEEEW